MMNLKNLKLALDPSMELAQAVYVSTLAKSHGESSMSPEDTKLIILQLRAMIETQQIWIGVLAKELEETQKKQTFMQKLFKK